MSAPNVAPAWRTHFEAPILPECQQILPVLDALVTAGGNPTLGNKKVIRTCACVAKLHDHCRGRVSAPAHQPRQRVGTPISFPGKRQRWIVSPAMSVRSAARSCRFRDQPQY
ncbi:MAG: hypothetical protein QF783_01700 [Arenicellales bacterium]|jgi:hypothetical protein|nr:hypothetical protein [Arenicellales bacterium]